MRIFFSVMLLAGVLLLFSCSSSSSPPPPKPTPQTLTWDAAQPTWDNGKWN